MVDLAGWARQTARCYVGNACSVRDLRSQLRGNRAILLWSLYLVTLLSISLFAYSQIVRTERMGIVDAQRQLIDFYKSVMGALSVLIMLIAPAMTAGSIVLERQRRSLDLVFSAPVSAKYYLTGKLISSYRYVWMLLLLSAPVSGLAVVLGGATAGDVFAAYAILSFTGLLFTAIGLLMSALVAKPIAAVVYTYLACGFIGLAGVGADFGAQETARMAMGAEIVRPAWAIPIVSVVGAFESATMTDFGFIVAPTWISTGLATLFFVRFLLLGAASSLSGFGSAETKSFRAHALVLALIVGFVIVGVSDMGGAMSVVGYSSANYVRLGAAAWASLTLLPFLPVVTCHSPLGPRRHWNDGWFSLRRALTGTPSGGLPFTFLMVAALIAPTLVVYAREPVPWVLIVWLFGLWALFWSTGRAVCRANPQLSTSRGVQFAAILCVLALSTIMWTQSPGFSFGKADEMHLLFPILRAEALPALPYHAVAIWVVAIALGSFALRQEARPEPPGTPR